MSEALILNVDDYDANRYLRSGVLRKAGYRVIEAPGGAEALRLARSEKPDLIVLDVQMPGIDGLEVCRRLRADPDLASILVLHVSATATGRDALVQGLDNGADGYLTDVADPSILLATVRALLRVRRAEEERNEAQGRLAEAEGRMARLLENIPDVAYRFHLTPAPRLEYISPAVNDLVGYAPEEFYADPGLVARVVHSDDHRVLDAFNAGRFEHRSQLIRLRTRDGRTVWTEHRQVPVLDDRGTLVSVEGVARDVTDQKRVEEELREANQLKDEFLATLSHELRTPLNAIVGWSQMLLRSGLGPELTNQAVEAVARNAMAQRQLINDVLDVSRIVTGKMRLDVQQVDLAAILRAAVESLRPAADAKGVDLVLVPAEPLTISGDADRLQQVFWNLVSNAVKFTPSGGRIEVSLAVRRRAAQVQVRDTGIGIPPAFLPRIFDRFSQADRAMNRRHHGLGLGLALVRHLVELHGGDVRAESEGEGRGATLTVTLPRRGPNGNGRATEVETQMEEPGPIAGRLSGVRVLIVDDEKDSRDVVATILRSAGARVKAAASVSDAVRCLDEEVPDLLLSDLGMPDQDGFDLIRQLRAMPPERGRVPAVALSAYGRAEDRRAALQAGFQAHVTKPVLPDDLVRDLEAILRDRADGSR